jgi:hypothetical protein
MLLMALAQHDGVDETVGMRIFPRRLELKAGVRKSLFADTRCSQCIEFFLIGK